MEKTVERGLDWAGLPIIATVARLLCRELHPPERVPSLGEQDSQGEGVGANPVHRRGTPITG